MLRVVCAASLLAGVSGTAALAADKPDPNAPIVVTASPLAGSADRFATIVSTVSRDQILQSAGGNLADALANVPGVSGSSFAAGASRPVIRGMDATRVKVLEDGVSSSDVSDVGPDHGVPIDPLSAQRIEVVRGAATLRYGSQAIGGVVNAINNRVPLTLPDKPLTGEVSATYATGADATQGAAQIDAAAGQFAFHVDGFGRTAGDYDTPLGVQANSFFHGNGFAAGSSYFWGDQDASHTGLAVLHYNAKYGIPSDTSYIDMRQTKVLSKSSFAIGAGPLKTITVDAGYADYLHDEDNPDGSVISTFKNKEWDGRAEALFDPIGPLSSTAIGVQAQKRDYSALGADSSYLFPTTTKSAGAFAFTEAPLGTRLNLQAAMRIEYVQTVGTPASNVSTTKTFTPISGSLGVLFNATDSIKLGLTATSAARAPAQTELFARGGHDGPQTYETGDPNLKEERANSLEATMRVRNGPFQFEGSAWTALFDNFIYGNLTGRTCDDNGVCIAGDGLDLKELNYGQRNAHFWGLEGKASYDLFSVQAGSLQAKALADYVRAQFSNNGGNVPRMTPYHVGAGLDWNSDAFDAGFMLLYVGRQDDIAFDETPTPGYVSLDVQASWRPLADHRGFEVSLAGHNLTDDLQRNAVSFNKDEVALPGRDVRLVLRETF